MKNFSNARGRPARGAGGPDGERAVPRPSLRRLPAYLTLLRELQTQGAEWISCTLIAQILRQDPTQVRKDLAFTGIVGKPKVGYRVGDLIGAIDAFLGWDNTTEAFLAGAGNLGRALLGYDGFQRHGLNIVAAFEVDERLIGTQVHGRQVLPLAKLPDLSRRMHVRLGVIAVPADAAQAVAELMVGGGMRGIWNFAPVRLDVPDDVIVENEHLSASLAVLSRRLARAEQLRSHPAVDGRQSRRADC